MNVQVFLTPAPLERVAFEEKTVVVIDVLRASTAICAMLQSDARGVIPTAGPGEAAEMWTKIGPEIAVLAGERNGVKIENFQYGNSPLEFRPETVGGKYVVMCTTNGTGIFGRTLKAKKIISGALVNVSEVAGAVAAEARDLVIICAGREGGFSVEDTLCAGMLISLLGSRHNQETELNDAASLADLLYDRYRDILPKAVAAGEHGRFLASIGFAQDVRIASEIDSMPVLPLLIDGRLVQDNSLTGS